MNISTIRSTIDTHVAGEAFRIVTYSPINLNKQDIRSNQELLHQEYQNECDFLLKEPRGHQGMQGCIILSSNTANFGVLFFTNNNKGAFSYSGLVAVITALLETGNLEKTANDNYSVETVYGIYNLKVTRRNQQVKSVFLESVGTRVIKGGSDYQIVDVDGLRSYVVTELPKKFQNNQMEHLFSIMEWGEEALEEYTKKHPEIFGVILTAPEDSDHPKVYSITFDIDGNIVPSPGMDSTLALIALAYNSNKSNKQLTNISIFNSTLTAQVVEGDTMRISVELQGFITGLHDFICDEDDPLQEGFLLS